MPVGFPPLSNLCILTSALELDLLRSEKNCRTNSVLYRGLERSSTSHFCLLFSFSPSTTLPISTFEIGSEFSKTKEKNNKKPERKSELVLAFSFNSIQTNRKSQNPAYYPADTSWFTLQSILTSAAQSE